MSDHWFISYSSMDGKDFALQLADTLAAGPPEIPVWVDKRRLRPGEDWDEQIVEAIRICKGLLFVMTADSVEPNSVCKNEWARALKYKKPVIPLLRRRDAELPFRLGSRQFIDFTGSFESALARLRQHLEWIDSPPGQLLALKYRLEDARRELPRAEPEQQARIQEDITELEKQIARQQAIIDNPQAAAQGVQQRIDTGLEREREPAKPVSGVSPGKFINPPPLIAPTWFQDRHVETRLIGNFLKDDALRLMTVVGRGGIGKTAMVCRLLRSLEGGQLPDDGGPLAVDGIVYLSDARQFHRVTVPDLYASLTKLLPQETVARMETVYKNPKASTQEKMQILLDAFPQGRTVVLLDNFEEAVDVQTGRVKDSELDEALRALLELPPHGLKIIITTRVAPRDLALVAPALQRRFVLDTGLEHPFAENILRTMDADGKVGLRDAADALLAQARERTRGYPRALEHLFGILSADRDTSLEEILADTRRLLPEQVVTVLVGEAFSRLDPTAQKVMQALATYRYPVPPAAIDYLLQSYVPGVDSSPVLSRLVNMQFARREKGRYYLHQVDRDYALSRIPEGEPMDREAETPPYSRFALLHRAAEWFEQSRKPRETWKTLDDLAPQLAEFELRCAGEDYDAAVGVLQEISFDYLFLWGYFRLMAELHERLQGKINNLGLAMGSVGNLGTAYVQMGGQYQRAIVCYEEALRLACEQKKNRWGEGAWLGNLGNVYAELGQTAQAIEHYEQVLVIKREVGDRQGEALGLGNLANCYSNLGQIVRAIEYCEQALAIFREIGDRPNRALYLCNLGDKYTDLGQTTEVLQCLQQSLTLSREISYRYAEANSQSSMGYARLDRGEWQEAVRQFEQAIEIADDIGNPQYQNGARCGLALARLYQGELAAARKIAESACKYDYPLINHFASAVLGLVALRQGDTIAARTAFATALNQANELLAQTPQLYGALNTKGFAQCGLALCEGAHHVLAAKESFQAARAITSAPGVIRWNLRLFDALVQADTAGILTEVRVEAAGENL